MSIYDLFLKNNRNKSNISNPTRQNDIPCMSKRHVLNAKTARFERKDGTF